MMDQLINELDVFMSIIAFYWKQKPLWPKETEGSRYAEELIEISRHRIYELMTKAIHYLCNLSAVNLAFVIDDLNQRCARKWMQIDPAEHMRLHRFLESCLNDCYNEMQRDICKHTYTNLNQPNKLDEMLQFRPQINLALLHQPIPHSAQKCEPQQKPPQAPTGPPFDLCQQEHAIFQLNQMIANFLPSNDIQLPMPYQIACNHNPPTFNTPMEASPLQLKATVPTQSQPFDTDPITQFKQLSLFQSAPNTISNSQTKRNDPSPFASLPLIRLSQSNIPSAPAIIISKDMPILEPTEEIPHKRPKYEKLNKTFAINRRKNKFPADHFLLKRLRDRRLRWPYSSLEVRNIAKCNAQNIQTEYSNEQITDENSCDAKNVEFIAHLLTLPHSPEKRAFAFVQTEREHTEDQDDYIVLIQTSTEWISKVNKIEEKYENLSYDFLFGDISNDSDSSALVIDC